MRFYYPRWFFPKNLGDSVMASFVPKILKAIKPDQELEVVTDETLGELFKLDPHVDSVRLPSQSEILSPVTYQYIAMQRNFALIDDWVVYPEWHKDVWRMFRELDIENHPSINIITLNYMLQLGISNFMHLITDPSKEDLFYPEIYVDKVEKKNAIGIVPDSKLAGRPSPHPGCDGVGFRFNGPDGLESWQEVVDIIKKEYPSLTIVEFSREWHGLGDEYINNLPFPDLAKKVASLRLGIMSDGGMHHVFNSQRVPVYLLGAQKVNKPTFFKLKNGVFDKDVHGECWKKCEETINRIEGWPTLAACCDGSCEKVSPALVANRVIRMLG